MSIRRVVITGIGVISPIGTGKDKFWKALIAGKNGIGRCRKLDTSKYCTHLAAEIKDFNPRKFIDLKKIKHPSLTTLYALAASKMALNDSSLDINSGEGIGVALGANTPDPLANAEAVMFWSKNRRSLTPLELCENLHTNLHVVKVAEYFGLKGPVTVIPAACAAGNTTISYAFEKIKTAQAVAMFAGSCDSINHLAYCGFDKMRAMAPVYCQPFDKGRKGMIIGEGAGIILLEEMEHALARNARIYGEMLGYGLATDAYSPAIPDPEGAGAISATRMALKMAKINPCDVDYINAHGTGTIANDRMEARVIKSVFQNKGNNVLVSSIKSMLGHCMGAASGIEACASALIVERDMIPPNINYNYPDPECDINIVANRAIKKEVNIMLSNSFAFGGNNAIIVLAKFKRNQ